MVIMNGDNQWERSMVNGQWASPISDERRPVGAFYLCKMIGFLGEILRGCFFFELGFYRLKDLIGYTACVQVIHSNKLIISRRHKNLAVKNTHKSLKINEILRGHS